MRASLWLAVVLLVVLPARAELRRPSLQWTRGPGAGTCIDALTLAARIEALTGPVFVPPSEYLIEGHIEARPGGWSMRVTIAGNGRTPTREREVEYRAADCRSFNDAIVFVIALLIDPDVDLERLTRDHSLVGRTPEDELLRELDENPPVPARPVAAARPPAPPVAPAPAPYRWDLSGASWFGAGELPGAAWGASMAVSFPTAYWIELGANLRAMTMFTQRELSPGLSVRAQAFAFAPLLCVRPPTHGFFVRSCIGAEPSIVHVRGFTSDQRALLSVWGVLAKLELGLAVNDRWSLLAQAFVRAGLEDKRLVYTSARMERVTFSHLGRTAAGAGLGVSYRFGSGKRADVRTHVQHEELER